MTASRPARLCNPATQQMARFGARLKCLPRIAIVYRAKKTGRTATSRPLGYGADRMIRLTFAVALAALVLPVSGAEAGPIRNACLQTDKGNRQVCSCIQQVADMTLRRSEQRRAAKFFRNPDKAQEVFLSKSERDNVFWERYQRFGTTAEAYCS